jgi:hypothetical protein
MRKKIFPLTLIGVILGILVIISPVSATPPEKERFSLWDDVSGERMEGEIEIDRVNASYSTQANVGEQKGKLYYLLKAYNPFGSPAIITWGMIRANKNGHLRFNGKFDSFTLAWIESYGLTGATYSIRPV